METEKRDLITRDRERKVDDPKEKRRKGRVVVLEVHGAKHSNRRRIIINRKIDLRKEVTE